MLELFACINCKKLVAWPVINDTQSSLGRCVCGWISWTPLKWDEDTGRLVAR